MYKRQTFYGIFTLEKNFPALGRWRVFDMVRKAEDNIEDHLVQWVVPRAQFGQASETAGSNVAVPDLLAARDAWINTFYSDWDYRSPRGWSTRHRVKWEWWKQRGVDKTYARDDTGAILLDDDGAPLSGRLHKVQGVCEVEPRILELASEPAIVDRIAALLGPNLDCFGTKFFPKLAGGTSTHWHQDNFYFGTTSDQIISCGIYLQDADLDNGCLQVVPQSHLMGEIVEHQRAKGMHGSWTESEGGTATHHENGVRTES